MSNEFPTWEEMSDLEQAQCIFWDMYKDAYGFRPRGIDTSSWTLEDFNKEFEALSQEIARSEAARIADEQTAIVKFCKRIEDVIKTGAGDRETALRWIHEADGSHGDNEYLCYLNGLPYGFFKTQGV